ncbi:MAG: TetR family transcriptional regulator [Caulobacteraceae bacterium]|nr:TetR family transcriptional regulator [Caulobacteraceae bacterium]
MRTAPHEKRGDDPAGAPGPTQAPAGRRAGRERPAAVDTKGIILDVAIRHFAAFGYEGAHVRKMLGEAGLNLALAHYHYGSKAALYEAAVRRYLMEVLDWRRAGLAAWRRTDGPREARLIGLFESYVEPHMRIAMGPGGADYARLMQRALGQLSAHSRTFQQEVLEVRRAFTAELAQFLPDADPVHLERGMDALVSVMLSESIRRAAPRRRSAENARVEAARAAAAFVARLIAGGLPAAAHPAKDTEASP